jgi:hypothetical protein
MISTEMDRRKFLRQASILATVTTLGQLPGLAVEANQPGGRDLMKHRFGVNYVPSRNWYYCYNDWDVVAIAHDFDRIAEIDADHLRVMVIWPWFQPNPDYVSTAHLDRLDQMMQLAAERKLDVLPTIYTGWLSGFHFNPPYLENEPFFTSPKWALVQDLYLEQISRRMQAHPNFLVFDIGNEINCNWPCSTREGDAWMERVFDRMRKLCPNRVYVNGVDHQPWFSDTAFTARALVAQQAMVALHCWPYWAQAGKYGKPLDPPYIKLAAGMTALARSLGNDPQKPVWIEEFGACSVEMPEDDVPRWLEATVLAAMDEGASWFTWWASHDVDRRFQFNSFEYELGLMTTDNRIKEQGRTFRELARAYRGQPVKLPARSLPPPPTDRNHDATWRWLLDWMGWKP